MSATDRVAIVGAGAAGVHFASELRKLGFQDVTIFEKTDRIGGKTRSVRHGGVSHEIGTSGFSMSDDSGLKRFIEEVFPGGVEELVYTLDIMTLRKHSFIVAKGSRGWLRTAQKLMKFHASRRRFYLSLIHI